LARLIYTRRALSDLERIDTFLADADWSDVSDTFELIFEAISVLANHSLIGRCIDDELRELIISRGRTGYVALYSYEQSADVVLILAIRHQRESGFTQD
jgi:plasmid stabilization system protein ParE